MADGALVSRLLDGGIADRVYPAAVLEVGRQREAIWRHATGRLTYEPDSPATSEDTVFDLASLTKVIVTTTLAMRLVERGSLRLSDRVSSWLQPWQGRDRADVRVIDLLEHCGGLTAWMPFYRDSRGRAEIEHAICQLPLEYVPWTRAIYSDLGFLLLGFLLEDAGGAALDRQAAAVIDPATVRFGVPVEWRDRTAPTEIDPWRGRLLVGDVDDENAWVLGGVAGHAGLFGTAGGVGAFARRVLGTCAGDTELARRDTLARFVTRSTVPRSSRAVGWDTMLPTSSCGTRLSRGAFGHTGFTGTSLWIDPARDLYVVLLTNRVHPTRDNSRLTALRPRLHDAVVEAFG
jgi:CubicO group peptidase (beta-lactamase class C family)